MKVLSTEQQQTLLEIIEGLAGRDYNYSPGERADLNYWSIELRPKRIRRKETHESVIEDAYKEHTGQI